MGGGGHAHTTVASALPVPSLLVSSLPHSPPGRSRWPSSTSQVSLLPPFLYRSWMSSLTGRRMKNIDTAPTIGRSPMSGSRITRKMPCSWGRKNE